jgi:hypothetical protein
VKWVHECYTKGRNVPLVDVPAQASWVIKKIFGAAKTISSVNDSVFQQANFAIKRMYNALGGEFAKVGWRKMICNNPTHPKCLFVTWLIIHARLPVVIGCLKYVSNVIRFAFCVPRRMKLILIYFFLVNMLMLCGKVL